MDQVVQLIVGAGTSDAELRALHDQLRSREENLRALVAAPGAGRQPCSGGLTPSQATGNASQCAASAGTENRLPLAAGKVLNKICQGCSAPLIRPKVSSQPSKCSALRAPS